MFYFPSQYLITALSTAILCHLLVFCPLSFGADKPALKGNGKLNLYNYHLDEFAEIDLNQGGQEQASRLLRSRDNGQTIVIDMKLLLLLDHLQDHFSADTIEIISGFRSKQFNAQLKKEGHAVSPVSLHMDGKATDIHIDEILEETLRDYLISLQAGGVGYYGSMDFIHVDVGPARQWGSRTPYSRKLIGVLQKNATLSLTSLDNDYLPGTSIKFHWSWTDTKTPPAAKLKLEHFYRGKWQVVASHTVDPTKKTFWLDVNDPIFRKKNGSPRYGKYRWIFPIAGSKLPQSSNEFYLKRL